MFRLLLLAVVAAAAFLMIEARWSPESLTLTLRVRTGKELVAATQGTARQLGARAMERVVGGDTPPVAAAPPDRQPAPESESLRESDRERLNRLVEEKSRER